MEFDDSEGLGSASTSRKDDLIVNNQPIVGCDVVPIGRAKGQGSTHALFFHRNSELLVDSEYSAEVPRCSIHHDHKASIQCLECVKSGIQEHGYFCSTKCFLGAWSQHRIYHIPVADASEPLNGDIKLSGELRLHKSWPPGELISWFDERLELVVPRGPKWVNKVGSWDAFVPLQDEVGFCFKLTSGSRNSFNDAMSPKDVLVTHPSNCRLHICPRSMIQLEDLEKSEKVAGVENISEVGSFRVLSYNILADIYTYAERYFYCPRWALTWEYRRQNLIHEIVTYMADIICLQEVQSDHFGNFLEPELAKFGYSAVYKKKTKEIYTRSGYVIDGCAIFFRIDRLKLVAAYELEYNRSASSLIQALEPRERAEASVRLMKDNVAVVAFLEMVENKGSQSASRSSVCVANTHIHASRDSPDVKLCQVAHLISELQKIIDKRIPLLICGDMNSLPESDPYVLLANANLDSSHGKEANDPLGIYQHLRLSHSFRLASAYSALLRHVPKSVAQRWMMDLETGEPLFTISTQFFKGTLDYIFYTVDNLEVESLLEIPDNRSVGKALPSPFWSSDHIALMASFRITKPFLR